MSCYHHTLAILEKLIAFDTTSRNSNLLLLDYVVDYLRAYQVLCHLDYNAEKNKANLFATVGSHVPGGIVFSGHTDVVPVDGQKWHSDPFVLTRREQKLYGRGTADMKSFLAVVLALIPKWQKLSLSRPVHLAFSYDEEVGCVGVHSLISYMQQQSFQPSIVIVGEPTSMRVVNGHKGLYAFRTTIKGYEAHSSQVHKGVNAIFFAARLLNVLEELQAECLSTAVPGAAQFDPPYTSFQVGVIQGGTALNIIPGECFFDWEFRIVPGENVDAIMQRFAAAEQQLRQEMQVVHPEADIVTEPHSTVPDLKAMEDEGWENTLLHLTHGNHAETVSFVTEAGIFQQHGFPTLICGPGSIDQAHKPDEYIEVAQIEKALEVFRALPV